MEEHVVASMKDENEMIGVCRYFLDYTPTNESWITTAESKYDEITIGIRCQVTQDVRSHRKVLR